MIKFFRHIRRNLMETGKTGKYFKYAIGEIVLVMIGILLALQVSEWNSNRKRQQQEAQILKDLHEEFVENKIQLDTVTKKYKAVRDGAENIIAFFPIDPKTVNIDSLSKYFRQMATRYTFNPQQSTVNALTNTSSFDLISITELRKLLQRWSELVIDYQEDELAYIRNVENTFSPYMIKHTSMTLNGIKDPRLDLKFLSSLEFENIVRLRYINTLNILGREDEVNEIDLVYNSINRIIELTKTND